MNLGGLMLSCNDTHGVVLSLPTDTEHPAGSQPQQEETEVGMREKLSSQVNSSSWLHLWNTSVFVSYLAWLLSAYLATAALEHKLKNVVQVLWLQKSFSFIFFFPFKSESNYFSFSSSLNSVAFLINPYQWDTMCSNENPFPKCMAS